LRASADGVNQALP